MPTVVVVAGAIALSAIAATSLGVALASAGQSVSGAGSCSKAEATAVVKRLGWSDLSPIAPVYKVLCGSSAGPSSRTMVASLSGPDNVGMLYWAVFRWSGNDWQLLLKRRQAAVLTAVGGDIKESVSIYRSGDSRCCPSGGTRARIWHWNGSRLVAGPWSQVLHLAEFLSPSRNLFCGIRDGDAASCVSFDPPHGVYMRIDGKLSICRGTRCARSGGDYSRVPILGYGKQTEYGLYRCRSQVVGITCTVIRSGKGFVINRDGVRRVGP